MQYVYALEDIKDEDGKVLAVRGERLKVDEKYTFFYNLSNLSNSKTFIASISSCTQVYEH